MARFLGALNRLQRDQAQAPTGLALASLSPEQREGILRAVTEETERAVVEVMGPKAYKQYLRSGTGKWISE